MKYVIRAVSFVLVLTIAVSALIIMPQDTASAAFVNDIEMHCDAYYMVNLETGIVVCEKNADKQKYPASLTKIMTCLLVIEYYADLENEKVTISHNVMNDRTLLSEMVWSPTGLIAGERMRLIDLLYCAMLASDNYASLALAYKVSEDKGDGTIDWFIKRMNQKARELGCTGTQFVNPHGLFNENHYSTARDMYLITRYALQLPEFANIVATDVHYSRPATNMNELPITFETTNHLMISAYTEEFYQYTKGVKTGFLSNAGHCFSTYASKDGYSYIIILLDDGAPTNYTSTNYCFLDAKAMFQWAFSDLAVKDVLTVNDTITQIPLEYAWGADMLDVVPSVNFNTLLPSHIQKDSINVVVDVPESLTAPLHKGQMVGTAELYYANALIGKIDLVASVDVERSEMLYLLGSITSIFESNFFYLLLGSLILFVILYIVVNFIKAQRLEGLKSGSVTASARTQVLWRDGRWRDPADEAYNSAGARTTPGTREYERQKEAERRKRLENERERAKAARRERGQQVRYAVRRQRNSIAEAVCGILYIIGETVCSIVEGKPQKKKQPKRRPQPVSTQSSQPAQNRTKDRNYYR